MPIFLLIVEFFTTRLRVLHRIVIFVVIFYLIFILINYIVTRLAESSVYEAVSYKQWTTLGFFVLYIVLIIVFFYLAYALGEWKFCILKGGSAINAGSWSVTESFSDSYDTPRKSAQKSAQMSVASSARGSLQSEFGRIGN